MIRKIHCLLKKRNPVHSIVLYWPDFQSLNLHSSIVISRKPLQNLVVHDFTLLLIHFDSKLTNFFKRNRSLRCQKKRKIMNYVKVCKGFLEKVQYLSVKIWSQQCHVVNWIPYFGRHYNSLREPFFRLIFVLKLKWLSDQILKS